MPWVDEWYISGKDAQGNNIWSNRQYYVAPATGEAGGQDYYNKVSVQTLTDANTGQAVVSVQNSSYDTAPANVVEQTKELLEWKSQPQTVTQTLQLIPGGGGTIEQQLIVFKEQTENFLEIQERENIWRL
jgi:hypothetical protein